MTIRFIGAWACTALEYVHAPVQRILMHHIGAWVYSTMVHGHAPHSEPGDAMLCYTSRRQVCNLRNRAS